MPRHVGRGLFISGLRRRAVWRQDTAGLTQYRPRAYGMAYQVTEKNWNFKNVSSQLNKLSDILGQQIACTDSG